MSGLWDKILEHLVEDDRSTRRLMDIVLQQAGYRTSLAADGAEALRVLDRQKVDLVLLDIMMPNTDGYELTRQIRQADEQLPLLMVTAKLLPEDKKRGFLVGTDDYMTKPVDYEEMLLRIKALLRRAKIVNYPEFEIITVHGLGYKAVRRG